MAQKKGTTTNLEKLAGWDIDYYLSLSDDECSVCLTQKELYLLRNPLRQMEWATRWQSQIGTPKPDIENIAERLAYKLSGTNCCEVDYCAEIVDCIETSVDVQNALDVYSQSRNLTSTPELNTQLSDNILDSDGCSPDVVFGQVTAVWNVINQTTVDFLEILSAAGNIAESVSMVISAIPIIGQLPADEIIDFVGKFGEWTLDAYNAFLTTAIENQIKCDLFCLAIVSENCTLTTANLLDYFSAQAGILSNVKVETVEELIQFIIELPTDVALAFICGMATAQLFVVSLLEKFLGISTIQTYIAFARLGDPSDDWVGICDDCGWSHTFDFTVDDGDFAPYLTGVLAGTSGEWFDSVGWQATNTLRTPNNYRREVNIERVFTSTQITRVSMLFDLSKGDYINPTTSTQLTILVGASLPVNEYPVDMVSGADQIADTSDIDITTTSIRLRIASSYQTDAIYSGNALIKSCTVWGLGTNPFE